MADRAITVYRERPLAQHEAINRFIGAVKQSFTLSATAVLADMRKANRGEG